MSLYQTVHEALHSSGYSGNGPPKLIYAVNQDEAVLGVVGFSLPSILKISK